MRDKVSSQGLIPRNPTGSLNKKILINGNNYAEIEHGTCINRFTFGSY